MSPSRSWTPDMEEFLMSAYGNISNSAICKRLGKSRRAVHLKAHRLRLTIQKCRDGISAMEIGIALGANRTIVARWVRQGKLRAKTIKYGKNTRYLIQADDFWRFVEAYNPRINWSRYDRTILPEPVWVNDMVKRAAKRKYSPVTPSEVARIHDMYERGVSWDEIASTTMRTKGGAQSILHNYSQSEFYESRTRKDA